MRPLRPRRSGSRCAMEEQAARQTDVRCPDRCELVDDERLPVPRQQHGAATGCAFGPKVTTPVYRRLVASMGQRRSLAALATLAIIVVMVIVPLTLITAALVQEAAGVYERIQSGELDFRRYFQQVFDALPAWAAALLDRFGLTNLAAAQDQLSTGLMRASQFLAAQAISIGQRTFDFVVSLFVMLYVLFFLLRDGDTLTSRVRDAIPLHAEQQHDLFEKFTVVIRATDSLNNVTSARGEPPPDPARR